MNDEPRILTKQEAQKRQARQVAHALSLRNDIAGTVDNGANRQMWLDVALCFKEAYYSLYGHADMPLSPLAQGA